MRPDPNTYRSRGYKMLTGRLAPFHRKTEVSGKKKQVGKKQTGTKILVRNIPFQASVRELRELFWYLARKTHAFCLS